MIEQSKKMPLMEFSRLGCSRERTIPLNRDQATQTARLFTCDNTRKKSSNRVPKSPIRTRIKSDDTGVKNKECAIFDNAHDRAILSRKKNMNRLLTSKYLKEA